MAIQREKVEQAHIVQLIRSIGGRVYVLGTRRPRGDHAGTCQSAGVPDLIAFLPPRPRPTVVLGVPVAPVAIQTKPVLLFVECKASGGRLRPEQQQFRELCQDAEVAHVVGDLDAVIAFLAARHYVKAEAFPHYRQPKERTA